MSQPEIAPSQPPVESQPVGRIETDTFCAKCHYNLFSQAVRRDERLGILIARCPECGSFQAAGHTNSAGRLWLQRLATVLLAIWVLMLLGGLVVHLFLMGSLQATYLDAYSHSYTVTGYYSGPDPDEPYSHLSAFIVICGLSILEGVFAGACVVTSLWHLRSRFAPYLAMLLPILPLALVAWAYGEDLPNPRLGPSWFLPRLCFVGALQMGGLVVGITFGRIFARGLLRVLLPPRALQYFAGLWYADNKTPPSAKSIEQPATARPAA